MLVCSTLRVERGVGNQRKPTYFDVDQTGFSPRQNPLELRKKNGRRVTAVERVLFHVASDIAGIKGLNSLSAELNQEQIILQQKIKCGMKTETTEQSNFS